MADTPQFFIRVLLSTALVWSFLRWNRSVPLARTMARSFYALCVLLSSAALVLSILSPFHIFSGPTYAAVFRVLIFRGWIVAGVGLSAAAFMLLNLSGTATSNLQMQAARQFLASSLVLRGLCLSVAIAFICTEIGKLTHDGEMREFFQQSGYGVWFLYFIIAGESIASLGLLFRRTTLPAAVGLSAIMVGAIATHAHNGDPFSDSLEAFHLLICLASIIALRVLAAKLAPAAPLQASIDSLYYAAVPSHQSKDQV